MDQVEQDFGKANANATAALSRFAFLIGRWRCEARVRLAHGEWQTLQATWLGRFILDGYAIADEYRMAGSSGELIVLGMNLRTYDATKQTFNIKRLNALAGTWVDLGHPGKLQEVEGAGRNSRGRVPLQSARRHWSHRPRPRSSWPSGGHAVQNAPRVGSAPSQVRKCLGTV